MSDVLFQQQNPSLNHQHLALNQETFRTTPITQTLRHLESQLHVTGIARLSNITGLDDIGLPVWQAIRPESKFLCVAQGKGLTDTQAKVSAIMESLELYHLERAHLPTHTCSYQQREPNNHYLNPEHLHHGCLQHPNLLEQPLHWIASTNLIDQSTTWLPQEAITMNMTLQATRTHYFRQTTTGIAGGNTPKEAHVKALLEVIERYTLTQWRYLKKTLAEQIELDISHPAIKYTLSCITQNDKNVMLYHIQNPWEIPVYFCEIIDHNPARAVGTCIGSGCHLDHAQAILAALLEAVQTRLTVISGSRDDNYSTSYQQRQANQPIKEVTLPRKTLSPLSLVSPPITADQAQSQLVKQLHTHGTSDILCIDHTHKDLNIPMMQIIIPSLGWT